MSGHFSVFSLLSLLMSGVSAFAADGFPDTGTTQQQLTFCGSKGNATGDAQLPSSDPFQEELRRSRTHFLLEDWNPTISGKQFHFPKNSSLTPEVALKCQELVSHNAALVGLNGFAKQLSVLEGIRKCEETSPSLPEVKKAALAKDKEACKTKYRKMYASKNTSDKPLELSVHFGYMDGGPLGNFDPSLKTALAAHLLARCQPGMDYQSCGFSREKGDDLNSPLIKSVEGPDGKQVKVRIKLVSTTESIKPQEGAVTDSQKKKSKEGEASFLESLSHDDGVFYIGHARSGNGPDFLPHAHNDKGEPTYAAEAYAVHDPGDYGLEPKGTKVSPKALMEKALAKGKADGKPSFLMLGACDSEKHFAGGVKKEMGDGRALVTFGNTTMFSTFLRTTTGAIHGILAQNCGDAFRNNLNADPGDNARDGKDPSKIKSAKSGAALLQGL